MKGTDFDIITDRFRRGDLAGLEEVRAIIDDFPEGCDDWYGDPWIGHAISSGNLDAIDWVIAQGVDLALRDPGGYTVFDHCLELEGDARYEVLARLVSAGADVNVRGSQDWTPLHRAAVMDDYAAMRMLLKAGADRSRRTRIDDYTTPAEEARLLGHLAAADFIDAWTPDGKEKP